MTNDGLGDLIDALIRLRIGPEPEDVKGQVQRQQQIKSIVDQLNAISLKDNDLTNEEAKPRRKVKNLRSIL